MKLFERESSSKFDYLFVRIVSRRMIWDVLAGFGSDDLAHQWLMLSRVLLMEQASFLDSAFF